MKAPKFWQYQSPTLLARCLTPFSHITHRITEHRLAKSQWQATVPVICCGNLSIGGTGKTIVALELGKYFLNQNIKIAFLTRGYKRRSNYQTPFQVNINLHTAYDVGDEAMLLAQIAPTWIGSNRALSAQAAIQHHAQLLIMDDGLQNPTLYQDIPLLILDGAVGFGNQLLLPAGPLRQSIQSGLRKIKGCILIGEDKTNSLQLLPPDIPVLQAFLKTDQKTKQLKGKSVIAFAGIGRPEKFFHSLTEKQLDLIHTISFPDHYFYQQKDLNKLLKLKNQYKVPLVTTYKDYVKLPDNFKTQIMPLNVSLTWKNPENLKLLFQNLFPYIKNGKSPV